MEKKVEKSEKENELEIEAGAEVDHKTPGAEAKEINPKLEKDKVIEGAKKIETEKKEGIRHDHILMGIRLSLLEISHRDIELIEKKRYAIMSEKSGEEALKEFKEFVWKKLLEVADRKK